MSTLHRMLVPTLAILAAVANAQPKMNAKEKVDALIGLEFTTYALGDSITVGDSSCIYEGGGQIYMHGKDQDDWRQGSLDCSGRTIVVLTRVVAKKDRWLVERVADALLLPPLSPASNTSPPRGLLAYYSVEGHCKLLKQPAKSFFAALNWNNRERINWRTGVKHAWTFDLDKARIVPLSTKDIICEYTAP